MAPAGSTQEGSLGAASLSWCPSWEMRPELPPRLGLAPAAGDQMACPWTNPRPVPLGLGSPELHSNEWTGALDQARGPLKSVQLISLA